MKLINPFGYVDPKGQKWDAPAGSIVDGASIPKFAWTIIGGPFEGKYRNASVIHDVACKVKQRPWQDVHEVFYTAMLASDVPVTTAKIMYAAVYHFGPRWRQVLKASNIPANQVEQRSKDFSAQADETDAISSKVLERVEKPIKPKAKAKAGKPVPPALPVPSKTVDIEVEITPQKGKLSLTDFEALQKEIKEKDFSLQEIRRFPPSPPQGLTIQ